MTIRSILLPLFVQIGLILGLVFWMAFDRGGLLKSGKIRHDEVALSSERWPPRSRQISNCFANQFEIPLLFFVLVILALITRKADLAFVFMEWLFVLSRIGHAVVHTTSNYVPARGAIYGAGVLVVTAMWIIFAFRILSAPIGVS